MGSNGLLSSASQLFVGDKVSVSDADELFSNTNT